MSHAGITLGAEVAVDLPGGITVQGTIASYRAVGHDRVEATIKTREGEWLTGVVIPRQGRLEIDDADAIARAVVAGRDLRLPVERQLHVLATAVLARGGRR